VDLISYASLAPFQAYLPRLEVGVKTEDEFLTSTVQVWYCTIYLIVAKELYMYNGSSKEDNATTHLLNYSRYKYSLICIKYGALNNY